MVRCNRDLIERSVRGLEDDSCCATGPDQGFQTCPDSLILASSRADGMQAAPRREGQCGSGSSCSTPKSAANGSPALSSRANTSRIVQRSGASCGSSSSSHSIGTYTGAPGCGRTL